MIDASFYRAFEDRHRGSRELVKSRLIVYFSFIQPLRLFYGACQGLDLGCGRGEWLELMREYEIDVQGVDLDQSMLNAARERGLNAIQGDAVLYLQSLPEESQMIVSGFHLAEHLPFEMLQTLIQESLRVLKPGGLLILETPNPENIVVGTANFYVDPTHQRPIPMELLAFLVEYCGFERQKVLRLQESSEVVGSKALTLIEVLNGVSPDYAVVAQKKGPLELTTRMNPVFEIEYGVTLPQLAKKYDLQVKAQIQNLEERVQRAEADLVNINNNLLWKIIAPLGRAIAAADELSAVLSSTGHKVKNIVKRRLVWINVSIVQRPMLKKTVLFVLAPFPSLKKRLKRAATVASSVGNEQSFKEDDLTNLSPRARVAYENLEQASRDFKKEMR